MKEDHQKAIQILKDGGIVIFPTDTAFGIGCRIDHEKAVKRLFEIRKRPETQAVSALVSSVSMAQEYLEPIPKEVEQLIKKYWPGALTIVLTCKKEKVLPLVRGGGSTLGVRMPKHAELLKIIQEVRVPILGPSANFHGKPTPYRIEDVDKELIKLVDFVLPGECLGNQVSTVIDCSQKPWNILRQGAVSLSSLRYNIKKIFINTASNKEIIVELEINGNKFGKKQKIGREKAQVVLPTIERLLMKHKVALKDIDEIRVNTGPGSFTGLRVGISIANALSYALNIPVNNKKIGELVEPTYR